MELFRIKLESSFAEDLKSNQNAVSASTKYLKLNSQLITENQLSKRGFLDEINILEVLISGAVGVAMAELVSQIKKHLNKEDKLIIKEIKHEREVEIIDTSNGSKITVKEITTEKTHVTND